MPIQIETLEPLMSDGYNLGAGDRVTIPEEVAMRWCGSGWAKAVNGEIPTGERKVIRAVVTPHGSVLNQNVEEAG